MAQQTGSASQGGQGVRILAMLQDGAEAGSVQGDEPWSRLRCGVGRACALARLQTPTHTDDGNPLHMCPKPICVGQKSVMGMRALKEATTW